MLEAKYYKDYRHNYIILQCSRRETAGSYQHRMLTSGKISEILKCYTRHINGTVYYYYDISSKTTLQSLYRSRKMSREQVKDVLAQLHEICNRLSGYFMDETGLVLQPEHIYYDLTDKKYIGLYYPDYKVSGQEACLPLMDFLLEHIDTEDQELAEKMYRIYEMSEEGCFTLEDALQILEEEPEPVQEGPMEPELSPVCEPMRESASIMPNFDTEESVMPRTSRKDEFHESASHKMGLFYPVFAVLSILSIAGAAAVWYLYELTRQEKTVLGVSAAAMGVCVLICLWQIIKAGKKSTAEGTRTGRDADRPLSQDRAWSMDEAYLREADTVSLEHVLSRETDLRPEPENTVYRQDVQHRAAQTASGQSGNDYGNTVFFDESQVTEYKLYAMDRKNKQHIELKKFPCTIGKMAGCVDHVLTDNSVSRIHARLDKEGERVLLTDMNSTNGTYRNGLRMQPQETVEIEAGDEIRFGNLNYCYR